MPVVKFQSQSYKLQEYESVLDCLLRNGQHVPYACKAGMCQACLVRSTEDNPPESAGKWVKKSLQEKNYCLSCQWVPDADVSVALPTVEEFAVALRITAMDMLNARVMRLRLAPQEAGSLFATRPGQYLSLANPAGVTRSYSIANDFYIDGFVEFHISSTSQGLFTGWLFNEATLGQVVHVRGPSGECFYTTPESGGDFPLILAGTGTGLAPLYGIVHDALARGHQGPISLFHGASTAGELYYVEQLQTLASQHPAFRYFPVCREPGDTAPPGCLEGDLVKTVIATIVVAELPAAHVYLCGNPDFVHSMRKQIFLAGARSSATFCDPFLERTVPNG